MEGDLVIPLAIIGQPTSSAFVGSASWHAIERERIHRYKVRLQIWASYYLTHRNHAHLVVTGIGA